jgi:hypothetical protein
VRDVSEEIEIARTKLRLRHAWDETAAMEFLATNTRERNAQADLDKWVRALWSSKDAEGYAKYLVVAATRTDQVPAALEASLAALKAVDAATAASAARKLLADASPDVRIAAARAILGTTPGDEAAGAALVAIADDRKIADLRTRAWALRSVKEFHVLDAAALKKRLADPRPEHAQIVDWLIDLTKCGSEPVSPEEQIAAWRRVADGPVELGVAKAVDKLVDLEDKASKARVLAALDRLSAALTAKAPGTEDVTMGMIERLREAAEAWPSEAPPK